jgi:hypothetical protein
LLGRYRQSLARPEMRWVPMVKWSYPLPVNARL